MNSKQALEHIIFEAKAEKPIFSMYYQEFLKPIEQDLEVLEAFKYFLNRKKEQKIITKELMYNATKIKEWLENNKENK